MLRILKKGQGVLAVSVWSTPDKALTIGIVAKAIREHFPAAVTPGAPMWFDFGSEDALSKKLTEIGFLDPQITRHTLAFTVSSGEEYWEGVLGISGRLQMLLKSISPKNASAIKRYVIGAAEKFRSGPNSSTPRRGDSSGKDIDGKSFINLMEPTVYSRGLS